MAAVTDLFLLDYKITGDEAHQKWCGVPQKPILENLDRLEHLGAAVILRCPILPDVNGTEEHLQGIAQAALHHPGSVKGIHIEPYHRLGISKAAQLGMVPAYEADVPEKEWMQEFARRLQELCGECIPVSIN
jgi:pyruvate formate lyase activating enzyme